MLELSLVTTSKKINYWWLV